MNLVIRDFWHESKHCNLTEGQPCGGPVIYQDAGYKSVDDMRRELKRRFPHRNVTDISGGVRCEGNHGTYQEVTLE